MEIIINLKTYQQGKDVVKLAKEIEEFNNKIIIGVQASDIYEINKNTNLRIYSQHVDPVKPGRHTGFILPEAVKKDGAEGSFINHSEHKLNLKTIKKTIKRCKEIKLETAVFVPNLKKAKEIEKLKPKYIIYEPPELVSGKISVSKSKPEIIKRIVDNISLPIIVGAGIKKREDIEKAKELGAEGIAVSSAITKSKNPKKALKRLFKSI
jgi:triosephosphate isomerase